MRLTLKGRKPDWKYEIIPEPEEAKLNERRQDNSVNVDSIPEIVVMVHNRLNTFKIEEFAIFAVC